MEMTLEEPDCQGRAMTTGGYTTYFQINEVLCVKIKARKVNPCRHLCFVINLAWVIKFFVYILLQYNF